MLHYQHLFLCRIYHEIIIPHFAENIYNIVNEWNKSLQPKNYDYCEIILFRNLRIYRIRPKLETLWGCIVIIVHISWKLCWFRWRAFSYILNCNVRELWYAFGLLDLLQNSIFATSFLHFCFPTNFCTCNVICACMYKKARYSSTFLMLLFSGVWSIFCYWS